MSWKMFIIVQSLLVIIQTCTAAECVKKKRQSEPAKPKEDSNHEADICSSGLRQSPIDINFDKAINQKYESIKYEYYSIPQKGVTILNNGNTITLSDFPVPWNIHGAPIFEEFEIVSIVLHRKSLHTLNKVQYPLEMHIMYYNTAYGDFVGALKHDDGIVVIAILYDTSDNIENVGLNPIVRNLNLVTHHDKYNVPAKLNSYFIPNNLYTTDPAYYLYYGSLVSSPCAEVVTWIVLAEPQKISRKQLAAFNFQKQDQKERKVQKIHGRKILYYQNPNNPHQNMGSAANFMRKVSNIKFFLVIEFLLWFFCLEQSNGIGYVFFK